MIDLKHAAHNLIAHPLLAAAGALSDLAELAHDLTIPDARINDEPIRMEAGIWVHPDRMGGAPCLLGHRLPTAQVAAMTYDDAADGWDLTPAQVDVARWYEERYGPTG